MPPSHFCAFSGYLWHCAPFQRRAAKRDFCLLYIGSKLTLGIRVLQGEVLAAIRSGFFVALVAGDL